MVSYNVPGAGAGRGAGEGGLVVHGEGEGGGEEGVAWGCLGGKDC